ncbi:MAG: hypothetical protein ABR585_04285 [Gemmatimonadaceae bacterium]
MKPSGWVIAFFAAAACASFQSLQTPQQTDWDRTLFYARKDVDNGNYFAADHVLDEFVRTHPATLEAREIAFWRAAYLVDPANPLGSLSGGIAALDGYLASDTAGRYREEAVVLRRTAVAAQGVIALRATPDSGAAPQAGAKDTVVVVSKSRDEQIASLREQLARSKEELAKLSAELDRIKKRLANPSP